MKLAKLLGLREEEAEAQARELEKSPLFKRLRSAGVLSHSPFPKAYFAAQRLVGLRLSAPSHGLGELLDGRSDLVALMRRVGEKRLREHFLGESRETDAQRAKACGISTGEAARLRGLVDELYIRTEFEPAAQIQAQAQAYSLVAGLDASGGGLRFFHRDLWKEGYRVDETRLRLYLQSLDAAERGKTESWLGRLEFLERRKTTLYRTLEALALAQAAYLASGDPLKRQNLTQRALSAALGVDPSAVNRLIANKAVELPWGAQAPIKALLPSAKALARERLELLARERPGDSDEALRRELASRHGIYLSRRSVAQYRQDLGLPGRGRRAATSG